MCHVETRSAGFRCDVPNIPIQVQHEGKVFDTLGLIDSGCQVTHVNYEIAEFLGIDPEKDGEKTITTGISGQAGVGYVHPVTINIVGAGNPFRASGIFVKNLPVAVLLGQENFFDKFNVRFEKSKGVFYIQRV